LQALARDFMVTPMKAAPPSTAETRLNVALEAIYRTFMGPAPAAIDGCPCCVGTRGVDVLLTTPLRELTGQALWRYVSGALLTIGSLSDFRYLLPRILDVSVNDPCNSNDPEIVLGKLQLAEWQSWSPDERLSIEEFVDAWFERELERDLAQFEEGCVGIDAESVLCGAARAGFPLRRWLIRLHDPTAAPVLEDLQRRYPAELSAFWEDAPAALQELSAVFGRGCT
jgi:hypothetical protein